MGLCEWGLLCVCACRCVARVAHKKLTSRRRFEARLFISRRTCSTLAFCDAILTLPLSCASVSIQQEITHYQGCCNGAERFGKTVSWLTRMSHLRPKPQRLHRLESKIAHLFTAEIVTEVSQATEHAAARLAYVAYLPCHEATAPAAARAAHP